MTPDQVIVITGPIGSGKSYVSHLFAQRGWWVLDADEVGHEVLREQAVIDRVGDRWPEVVVHGNVDRQLLAARVFDFPSDLRILEEMTHPPIRQRIDTWLAARSGPRAVEVSVPHGISPNWGETLLVEAPVAVRMERLQGRGMDVAEITRRIKAQPPRGAWLAAAKIVLDNGQVGPSVANFLLDFLDWRV
jgi:dephospho-CoA kinase